VYIRIVVPLDGSYLAERALGHARELARCTGAPLHLVRVVDLTRLERVGTSDFGMTGTGIEQAIAQEDRTARHYLVQAEATIGAEGMAATSEVRHGLAARELVAAVRPDDLIVMTSHGRGGLSGSYHGSVAEEVLRRSPAPVLVIRADQAMPYHPADADLSARS
jgi:nucleotide-binding universal stress UspA family protein